MTKWLFFFLCTVLAACACRTEKEVSSQQTPLQSQLFFGQKTDSQGTPQGP